MTSVHRWFAILVFGALAMAGCGSNDNGAGACELKTKAGYNYCYDYQSDDTETGEQTCQRVGPGVWTKGSTCSQLGYTAHCSNGSWALPGSC
jgi:hypothetical protein